MATKSLLTGLLLLFFTSMYGQLKQVDIGNAEINYVEAGTGIPVVFIHAGLEDYRMWESAMKQLQDQYHVIALSRRYNYPNKNTVEISNFSAESEADDIASFVRKLNIKPAHVVGHAFGGLVALTFAKKYPELTRSLTISETPLIAWLKELEGGQEMYDEFHNRYWRPLQIAFPLRDTADVFRHTFNYFYGENIYPSLPPHVKETLHANLQEWKMMTSSPLVITPVTRDDIKNLKVPVMLITTDNSFKTVRKTNVELLSLLPNVRHYNLTGAKFDMWKTHEDQLLKELKVFYSSVP